MSIVCCRTCLLVCALAVCSVAAAQEPEQALENLVTRGELTVRGQTREYVVRHLPPASFPDLPDAVAKALEQRGCLIPQTYAAHGPENVVRGSFERRGSQDWAVLCSAEGKVSLLVFFSSAPGKAQVLATAPETSRLQAYNSSRVLGFNWGIEAASADTVHEAQSGLSPRPPLLTHDAVGDSVVDRGTVYHYYSKGEWSMVEMPE